MDGGATAPRVNKKTMGAHVGSVVALVGAVERYAPDAVVLRTSVRCVWWKSDRGEHDSATNRTFVRKIGRADGERRPAARQRLRQQGGRGDRPRERQ